jgi:hypothetical protein
MSERLHPLNVAAIAQQNVLAGAAAGQAARPVFEEIVARVQDGSLLVLDFGQVGLVTSSYFLGAFGWIWTSSETEERDLFPVLANANEETKDEIDLALQAKGFRALFAVYDSGELTGVVPLNLEKADLETYRMLEVLGEVTASDLFRTDPRIQPTGWSNRLALLYGYRLVRRRKQGRQLFYSLSWR